ncbi:MAG: hypothetical protein RML49_08055, partial [Verrucomicrobiae bacterium]|nr:hypothetical protein [Verrucomicrobiae bacterium]
MKRKSPPRPQPHTPRKNTASLALILLIALPTVLFIQTATFQFLWDDARGTILKLRRLSAPARATARAAWGARHRGGTMPSTPPRAAH